jgi:hypothetical protein
MLGVLMAAVATMAAQATGFSVNVSNFRDISARLGDQALRRRHRPQRPRPYGDE